MCTYRVCVCGGGGVGGTGLVVVGWWLFGLGGKGKVTGQLDTVVVVAWEEAGTYGEKTRSPGV